MLALGAFDLSRGVGATVAGVALVGSAIFLTSGFGAALAGVALVGSAIFLTSGFLSVTTGLTGSIVQIQSTPASSQRAWVSSLA
jgi:hypothetical protein